MASTVQSAIPNQPPNTLMASQLNKSRVSDANNKTPDTDTPVSNVDILTTKFNIDQKTAIDQAHINLFFLHQNFLTRTQKALNGELYKFDIPTASELIIKTGNELISDSNVVASKFGQPLEIQIKINDLPQVNKSDFPRTTIEELVLYKYGIHDTWNWTVTKTDEYYKFSKTSGIKEPTTTGTNPSPAKPKFFGIVSHHNQMLDALKKIDSIDKPNKKGRVIIHVDTHSDLMRSRIKRESIADFLNTVLAQGQCSEIYWVLPDWTKDSKVKDTFWNNNSYKLLFLDDKTEDTFYVKNGNVFFTKPEDLDGSYKTVKFHKVTIDDLPSFAAKKNVQLDIDSDYFSNTGFDTAGEVLANNNPSTTELSENLQTFTRKLEDKGINPEIVTLARSPNYTSPEDLPIIEAYFKGIYGNSAITELALHGWDKESDMYLLAELYNSVQDSPTKKMQNPNFQDLDNMLVRNPFEFVKMAKENPTKLLKERGFPELLEFYETYKNNPDATNKNKLLTAIEDTLALLNKRIYPSNNI